MNERIQELSEQAKAAVPAGLVVDKWIQRYNEEYARLIIEECIQLMHEQETIPAGNLYSKPTHIHELAIKQHFGVK